MGFKQITPPPAEPVSLADMKTYLHVSSTDEDTLLSALIASARAWAEDFTRRKFITQKWCMYLDAFPGYIDQRLGGNIVSAPIAIGATSYMAGIRWAITPPWPPVQSIDSLVYTAPDNTETTMTEGVDYFVDIISNPARVTPMFGKFWPVGRIQMNAVKLTFTTGYGDPSASPPTGVAVPDGICTAIKALVAHWYDNRWGTTAERLQSIPYGVESLLYPYRDLRM